MLIINNLDYNFKLFHALKNISLNLAKSSLVGLLGPNGCGKTTLLKILGASYQCKSGEIKLFNQNALDASGLIKQALRREIGLLYQNTSSDLVLSAWDNLKYFAQLMGINKSSHEKIIRETLDLANLSDRAFMPVKYLSHGMRRRLEIYRAFMHKPKLLLLDEPTEGLDFEETAKFWVYIKEYIRQEQALVILATHRALELEYCDEIIMLHEGQKIAQSSPLEFLAALNFFHVEVTLKNSRDNFSTNYSELFSKNTQRPNLFYAQVNLDILAKILSDPALACAHVQSVRVSRPELHDAYEKQREYHVN